MIQFRYILSILLTCSALTLSWGQGPFQVSGTITTFYDGELGQVQLTLTDGDGNVFATYETDCDGTYVLDGLFADEPYFLQVERPAFQLDGLSAFDLVMMTRHLIGVQEFDTPYQLWSADVDGSGTVSVADILWIQTMVLGIITEIPEGEWGFFVNGETEAIESFPILLTDDLNGLDFFGVKKGDVNGSATTCN